MDYLRFHPFCSHFFLFDVQVIPPDLCDAIHVTLSVVFDKSGSDPADMMDREKPVCTIN